MRVKPTIFVLMTGTSMLFLGAGTPSSNEHRGLDPANLDPTVSPGRDFYQYANGGWLARTPIPAEYSRYGSFEELMERNFVDQRGILEEAASMTSAPKGTNAQQVGDLYASAMDTTLAEQLGLSPLAGVLIKIDAMQGRQDIAAVAAWCHVHGLALLFDIDAYQDAKASTHVIAQIAQGGLGMPDRDYYTKDDDRSKMLRDEYVQHVTKMLRLSGMTSETASASAKSVMDIETELARGSMTRVQRRDPVATYNKMSAAQVADLAPAFDWSTFFNGIGSENPGAMNVGQPEFLKTMNRLLGERSVADWKAYFRWHVVHDAAPLLSNAFVQEQFHYYGAILTGAKEIQPRWKRSLNLVNSEVGEALGILYVKKFFPPQAKARALKMVNDLRAAFRERIQTREWMSDQTKSRALSKLDAFQVKIGYPDKWRDYSGLDIDRGSLVANVMHADSFEFKRRMNKIGKPVDRTEWGMTPPTVNAYYNPLQNEIVFPAGILQPPFFDPNADDAVNYGGMGSVIGHEMTHGFDDEGSQFDAQGNLSDWWTPTDKIAFAARTRIVEKEFDGFVAIDTLKINGKLTLGENIADLGGLTLAYAALQKAVGKNPVEAIDDMSADQRFFLAWAQIWRANYRPEELRRRLIIDPHSPGRFRTIGPLVNIDAFYKAFDVKEGDPMFLPMKERARIW